MLNVSKHISTNIHSLKDIKGSVEQQYLYYTRQDKNILVVLHIYEDSAIILLFFDHQDTESESCEIEMSISQPILTHKNI